MIEPIRSADNKKRIKRAVWVISSIIIPYLSLIVYLKLSLNLEGLPSYTLPFDVIKYIKQYEPVKYGYIGWAISMALLLTITPYKKLLSGYGQAHWASMSEIKGMGLLDNKGVILGIKNGKYIRTDEPLSISCIAPPGSGKTLAIVIPSLLSCGNSAIVHDPKGEIMELTAPHRSKYSKIIQFAPGEINSARWNPLSKKELPEHWADIQVHVDRVATTIIKQNKKDSGDDGDYWTIEARSVFTFWALYLIYKKGETSLPEVLEEAFRSADLQGSIAKIMVTEKGLPRRLLIEGNALAGKASKEFSGAVQTFKSKMAVFLDDRVADNLRESDFSLGELRERRTTVYLNVRNDDQTRLGPLISLFIELAALKFISIQTKNKGVKAGKGSIIKTLLSFFNKPEEKEELRKITLYLDEFPRIPVMKELIELPAISRGYNLNILFICQSYNQIVDRYGDKATEQLFNSCAYHVYFTQNEFKVAKNISDSIGNCTRKRRSYSQQTTAKSGSESMSHEGVPLILPQEIMSLAANEMIICVQRNFQTPIKCTPAFFYTDNTMKPLVVPFEEGKHVHVPGNAKLVLNEKLEPEVEQAPVLQEPEELKEEETLPAQEETPEEIKKEIKKRIAVCDQCGRETDWKQQFGKACLDPDPETFELCKGVMREDEPEKGSELER